MRRLAWLVPQPSPWSRRKHEALGAEAACLRAPFGWAGGLWFWSELFPPSPHPSFWPPHRWESPMTGWVLWGPRGVRDFILPSGPAVQQEERTWGIPREMPQQTVHASGL